MRYSEAIKYYSRPEVCAEIARLASGRETIAQYGLNNVGKRPDIIELPGDVKRLARLGATSFHTSEEIWNNPLSLGPEINPKQMNDLRAGWDLIIDIDSPTVEYGKITAELILKAFRFHDIENASLKYSGNKGFHIGIPFKAMPKSMRGEEIKNLFPDAPRVIAKYLQEFIRPHLSEAIIEKIGDLNKIIKDTGKKKEDLIKNGKLDPYKIIELDTILIAPRHLFRMPYSLHEKSGLVSVVLKPEELKDFDKNNAKPELVKEIRNWFLNPDLVREGEATQLIVQAFDWEKKVEKKEDTPHVEFEAEIEMDKFPPCVKNILAGLEDGKKRSLFVLLNFFKCVNWSMEKIEFQVNEWNKKNRVPLKSGYIKAQINWHKAHIGKIPPPNCESSAYYKDIGVCKPIASCKGCKNPLTFVARKTKKSAK